MDFNRFFQSKSFKISLVAIGAFIVLSFVFKVGVFVGYSKARFSYSWGENYHRNFAGPQGGFFDEFRRGFGDRDFMSAHGAFGSVIRVDGNIIVMKGEGGVEKNILVLESALVRRGGENIKAVDLKPDEEIVVLGSPNDEGQIEAKLIRVFGGEGEKLPYNAPRARFF